MERAIQLQPKTKETPRAREPARHGSRNDKARFACRESGFIVWLLLAESTQKAHLVYTSRSTRKSARAGYARLAFGRFTQHVEDPLKEPVPHLPTIGSPRDVTHQNVDSRSRGTKIYGRIRGELAEPIGARATLPLLLCYSRVLLCFIDHRLVNVLDHGIGVFPGRHAH